MKKIFSLLIASFLACAVPAGARAATITHFTLDGDAITPGVQALDPGDSGTLGNTFAGIGDFVDTYQFTVSTFSEITSSVVNSPVAITSFVFQLFQGDPTDGFADTLLPSSNSSSTFDGIFQLLALTYSGLAPGPLYYLLVSGHTTASTSYGGSFQISAVPLPPAIWLLASALVGLAGISRIRQRAN